MAEPYDDHSPRAPSADVIEALRLQYTAKARFIVMRYAKQRARMVREAGRPCPPLSEYVRELIHDVYADTWSGALLWDPDRCSLVMHLCAAIKARTWWEIKRAARYTSLDAPAPDDPESEGDNPEPIDPRHRFSSSPNAVGPAVLFPALIRRVCDALRAEARGERAFLDILAAWEQGITEPDEIMAMTGLDLPGFRRIRARILYVAARLTLELRQLVRDYLGSL